ncbi:uncharacterized protein Z520_00111 [Fonsecaea multimorphosa CBS 102226]|uniref:Short chain oxidoreductase n=1 Tax=Fonsecaea multimorphosa CBS 102226 TaxID=1442371 RepID=A0A0D2KJ04_9EURO|nr:uncharacterized protein Z520_00111 [Fonsecaea multimorphosa CBS 102226]KIY03420.1 hypothetical protein Z520_00111 [Fonsecaea multimorphosa CBS 102226]OAL33069.1 hypothetical protein AYO22_00154 [Fonsecaea multimorphosa]
MSAYLVTGAGRGLGLEFISQLSKLPEDQISIIFAATRSDPSDALQQLITRSKGRVVHLPMVITDRDSIKTAVAQVDKTLAGKGLDVLINNAGVMPHCMDGIETMDNIEDVFKVNVAAVHDVTAAFLPLLRKGGQKKVLNITSTLGSKAMAPQYWFAPVPAYKVSKAALNMLTLQYALELGKEGFTFLMVSPGYLKTDMSGDRADLPVEVGARATLDILFKSTTKDNGSYQNIHVPGWENVEGPNKYGGGEVSW